MGWIYRQASFSQRQCKYGKNITDITQEEEISNTVTGVVPYWSNMDQTDVLTLTEKAVYSQYAGNYPYHLTVPLNLSDKWEGKPTEAQLRAAAESYVNKTGLGLPKVSIDVSFVALWQTEEYKDIAPLERVNLGDTIKVHFEKLGIDTTARIVGVDYNVLKNRYNKVQVGSAKSTFAKTVYEMDVEAVSMVQDAQEFAGKAANNATKWLTSAGGYVMIIRNQDGTWKELVFSSKQEMTANDAKILRINNNGIGFSQTGLNGTYTNAWTIDGNLVADFIHGGTLTLGGDNNVNGWLKILDAAGNQIGKWDKDGIVLTGTVNATSGSLDSVTVNSLTMGGTTWTGTQLNDRITSIASIATQASNAVRDIET